MSNYNKMLTYNSIGNSKSKVDNYIGNNKKPFSNAIFNQIVGG